MTNSLRALTVLLLLAGPLAGCGSPAQMGSPDMAMGPSKEALLARLAGSWENQRTGKEDASVTTTLLTFTKQGAVTEVYKVAWPDNGKVFAKCMITATRDGTFTIDEMGPPYSITGSLPAVKSSRLGCAKIEDDNPDLMFMASNLFLEVAFKDDKTFVESLASPAETWTRK